MLIDSLSVGEYNIGDHIFLFTASRRLNKHTKKTKSSSLIFGSVSRRLEKNVTEMPLAHELHLRLFYIANS